MLDFELLQSPTSNIYLQFLKMCCDRFAYKKMRDTVFNPDYPDFQRYISSSEEYTIYKKN